MEESASSPGSQPFQSGERPTEREADRRLFDPTVSIVTLRVISVVTLRAINPDLRNLIIEIPLGSSRLGRDGSCEMMVPDPTVSRHHCTLFLDERGLSIQDNNSLHGIWINGSMRTEYSLEHGDILKVGDVILAVEILAKEACRGEVSGKVEDAMLKRPSAATKLISPLLSEARSETESNSQVREKKTRSLSQRLSDLFQKRHAEEQVGEMDIEHPDWKPMVVRSAPLIQTESPSKP